MTILSGASAQALAQAAETLAAGGLVGLPTETVYGLGARADDDTAVAAIFAAKGRPADHPLIVHVLDAAQAQAFAASWPEPAQRLAAAFWPGPLTVIVPRAEGMAHAAAGGQPTVGLRCPAHPVAQALLAAAAKLGVRGVAAPSANRFGRVSPTSAAHVAAEFGPELTILDGGDCDVGIESAIVDCSGERPTLLRPGVLTRQAIEQALGQPLHAPGLNAPKASGTLEAHYAPRAKVRLMSADELRAAFTLLQSVAAADKPVAAVYSRTVFPPASCAAQWPHRRMPDNAPAAAHQLFAAMRALDDTQAPLLWIERPPETPEWEGVRDRLQRAAAA